MKLMDALQLRPGDVVAFVGAGGKTSAMFRLAQELSDANWRVITTTTTRMAQDELRFAPQRVGFGHGMRLPDTLPQLIDQYRHVFVFTKIEPDSKVRGVRAKWLDDNLAAAPDHDFLLVEADGSRRLPMKAPKPDEPAMPASATVVVPVVGLDALGEPLTEEMIYGADLISTEIGYPPGQPITPLVIASVTINPQLGLKNVPPGARVIPLFNKATPENLPLAREIVRFALTDHHIERALIGAVQQPEPVLEAHGRVGAIVLAAGQSIRMGQPKLLLPWKGHTIIREVCEKVASSPVYDHVVVAGAHTQRIEEALEGLSARIVTNYRYDQGDMLVSLQAGLEAIWHTCDAALIVLGDQPALETEIIEAILLAYAEGRGRIIAPSFQNRRGHPILIDKYFWPFIMELPQGSAPRDLIRANEHEIHHVIVSTHSIIADIDTPEDYNQALQSLD